MAPLRLPARLPAWVWALSLLALLALRLPVLSWGFGFDDYTHQWVLNEEPEHPTLGATSLFDFGSTPVAGSRTYEEGVVPFWSDPDMRARFLRPLTSLAIALEHRLFGSQALAYHLCGLALFALQLGLLARLYLRLGLEPGSAWLALLVFGLEDGSTAAVGWIANSSTLYVALGVTLCLSWLHEARTSQRDSRAWLAVLAALFALAAKESGVAALAILALAGVLGLHRDWPPHDRLARASALVAALLALVYALAYVDLGYGTSSAFYPTPWTDVSSFVRFLALHLTSGLATMAGPVITDIGLLHEETRPILIALGALVLALLVRPLARSVRELACGRLLLAIGILGFLPQLMAAPSDRLIFVPMIGWAPLLAAAIRRGLRSAARAQRVGARALATSTLLLSPLSLLAIESGFGDQIRFARESLAGLNVGQEEASDLIVLQAPFGTMMLSARAQYRHETADRDLRIWPLQFGRRGLRVTRSARDSLSIETLDESFLTLPFEYVYRSKLEPPQVGRLYTCRLFEARVAAVDARGVRRFELRLCAPDARGFDSPDLCFARWDGEAIVRVAVPAVGQSLELEQPPPPFPFAP